MIFLLYCCILDSVDSVVNSLWLSYSGCSGGTETTQICQVLGVIFVLNNCDVLAVPFAVGNLWFY